MSSLLEFYRGNQTDAAGRTIEEIWSWDHRRLEMAHDFVQWLFPLPDASRFYPDAPRLTESDIAAFRSDATLRARVCRSLDLMLSLYGLARTDRIIARSMDFSQHAHWLSPLNHNHLRLTRILLFLRHAGLAAESDALLSCLLDIAGREGIGAISERTLTFWKQTKDA